MANPAYLKPEPYGRREGTARVGSRGGRPDAIIEWVSDCTFCEIVAGRLSSYRVLEDEHTLAFLNIRPASRGHTLVVPRVHARDVWEISEVSHGKVADMVHRVAALLQTASLPIRSALSPPGTVDDNISTLFAP